MTNRTGRGRPNLAAYVTSWGQTIDGACKSNDGKKFVLRPIGKSNPKFSLNDEARAVHKFLKWQSEQGEPQQPEVPVSMPMDDTTLAAFHPLVDSNHLQPVKADMGNAPTEIATTIESIRLQERNRLRQLLLIDPKSAALEFDIPHLGYYPETPDKPQYELTELAEIYVQNKRNKKGGPLATKYKYHLKTWWNEFLKIVDKPKYVRDITKTMIVDYHLLVMSELPNNSPAYVKSRFSAIKAIFNYGIGFSEDDEACRKVHDYCRILVAPLQKKNPKPMKREHFEKLLAVAKPREKAILLWGMNLAMHSGEVGATLFSECNFDDNTYAEDRHKTDIPRVGKLWNRTIEAIKEYRESIDFDSKYLFATRTGGMVSVQQLFLTLRKNAKLPSSVTFESVRDGAYTVMFTADPVYARWVGGHASWTNLPSISQEITTHYVERDANNPNVIKCCEAVEKHYFG